jgi:C-methyltransferase C-terminal domain/Putative zinc binding domain/Methyltransferase domain
MKCRFCQCPMNLCVLDLGSAPPSNAYLTRQALQAPELWYPLRVLVCEHCWLVQTEDFARADELFSENYAYFSGISASWLAHAQRYVEGMTKRFELNGQSHVVEVAANDGYLLQYFQSRGIPSTGIEPTASTAQAARSKGLSVVQDFFGTRLAAELRLRGLMADLMVANNVLAHVPDISDFVAGFKLLLKPFGVVTFEFPHLLRLIDSGQFDTIYHEHFSYLSFTVVNSILAAQGLSVFDVEQLDTHGGSLRVYAQHADVAKHTPSAAVSHLLGVEREIGVQTAQYYVGFQTRAEKIKNEFLGFLLGAAKERAVVAAYGAAAKGNTLLNFAGVRSDLISFVSDRNTVKQGAFLPGSRIPVVSEEKIAQLKPKFVVILPWNLAAEISEQLGYVSTWGGRLVTAIPRLEFRT